MIDASFTHRSLLRQLFVLDGVPPRAVVITASASLGALAVAFVQGWPLWALALATLIPWVPAFATDLAWTAGQSGALALFSLLMITQGGHVLEHVAQMVQIHVLGRTGPQARGVFGQLDVEWVHVAWNTWVLAAVVALIVLLPRGGRSRWLTIALLLAAWHEAEHLHMMAVYLETGRQGTPGLLAMGGRIAGGLPLSRPDLHFLYNLIETIPLFLAFVHAVRHVHASPAAAEMRTGNRAPLPARTAVVADQEPARAA